MTRRQRDMNENAYLLDLPELKPRLSMRHVQSVVDRHRSPLGPKPVRLCVHSISEFRVCMSCPPNGRMWQGGKV